MNTFMHGPSFFSFHFLSFSISFPKLSPNHFYYFTSLYGLQDVENHCTHLRDFELKTGRKIPSPLSPYIILYIIGLESMRLQNQKEYIFSLNPEKRTQKQAQCKNT